MSKRSGALHGLFQANTADLQTSFDKVYPAIADDPIVKRLDLSPSALEDRWNAWKRTQETSARASFDEMLGENSFVEFWGKMRKKTLDEKALAVKEEDEMEEGEGMGDGGGADLTAMGRQIDLEEIKSVLRVSGFDPCGPLGWMLIKARQEVSTIRPYPRAERKMAIGELCRLPTIAR